MSRRRTVVRSTHNVAVHEVAQLLLFAGSIRIVFRGHRLRRVGPQQAVHMRYASHLDTTEYVKFETTIKRMKELRVDLKRNNKTVGIFTHRSVPEIQLGRNSP